MQTRRADILAARTYTVCAWIRTGAGSPAGQAPASLLMAQKPPGNLPSATIAQADTTVTSAWQQLCLQGLQPEEDMSVEVWLQMNTVAVFDVDDFVWEYDAAPAPSPPAVRATMRGAGVGRACGVQVQAGGGAPPSLAAQST